MAKRYVCPDCETGRHAPGRMAPDDVRRFCLPCSEERGKLVRMGCPSRERERERKRKVANGRAKEARRRELEKLYYLTDGTDVREIIRDVRKLRVWKVEGSTGALRKLKYSLEARPKSPSRYHYEPKDVALDLIHMAAQMTLAATGKTTNQTNMRGLVIDGACQHFGLSIRDVVRVERVRTRLGAPARDIYEVVRDLIRERDDRM